uniref:Ion_trans domain-containing protein n=1 Tax=Heterorhabditis bacteriophora TaxID=37862 RepID=A0A1I7WNF0_HETBA
MNNFISAFYDAVLLYAIALNETIAAGMDPRNGHNITSKMWGRTFDGVSLFFFFIFFVNINSYLTFHILLNTVIEKIFTKQCLKFIITGLSPSRLFIGSVIITYFITNRTFCIFLEKEKKKAKKKRSGGYFPEADPLLRSNSRGSVNSDKWAIVFQFDDEVLSPMAMRMRLVRFSSNDVTFIVRAELFI